MSKNKDIVLMLNLNKVTLLTCVGTLIKGITYA